MAPDIIEGTTLKQMFTGGLAVLEKEKNTINALNVFPVPDGDTGTNMFLTLSVAVEQLKKENKKTVGEVVRSVADSSLMGARGNSGVILSQLFRGFSKSLSGKEKINVKEFADALQEGVNTAYKAVMKPVEGTMLTVAREAADSAAREAPRGIGFVILLEILLKQAEDTLKKTPDMLPVLKEAGVVDAGGKGLCAIYRGFLKGLQGHGLDVLMEEEKKEEPVKVLMAQDLLYQYCTEFVIRGKDMEIESLKNELSGMGDSLLVVGGGDLIKVHIHTNNPGQVLEAGINYGELSQIKIDNMKEQHREYIKEEPPMEDQFSSGMSVTNKIDSDEIQIIAVSPGEGISEIFQSLGVAHIIEGGQTMNPSIEDFLQALRKVSSDKVIILPNNKNIILSAEQSKALSSKKIKVIPSKTIPQGISALMHFDPILRELEDNALQMEQALSEIKTGQVTYAIRESTVNGIKIKEGSIIGLEENEVKVVGDNPKEAVISLIKEMFEEDDEIITLYYGKDITEEEAKNTVNRLLEIYPDCQIEYYKGGQPLYYYFLSIE